MHACITHDRFPGFRKSQTPPSSVIFLRPCVIPDHGPHTLPPDSPSRAALPCPGYTFPLKSISPSSTCSPDRLFPLAFLLFPSPTPTLAVLHYPDGKSRQRNQLPVTLQRRRERSQSNNRFHPHLFTVKVGGIKTAQHRRRWHAKLGVWLPFPSQSRDTEGKRADWGAGKRLVEVPGLTHESKEAARSQCPQSHFHGKSWRPTLISIAPSPPNPHSA